ncbi:facilitated trehalose transporter Tret1-like [Adelges cooleyi]|uniref:facilitated trehalose transporter Tret1-like n=1 Tax=Adelges cooleyi TaxID=133065 RepID=UPI00217F7AD8|nr:facilitated trehalose transporter Tret1-like [Adelges cooleyi]XP_050434548.1 facilitated trehalose transporter Tret1-like [Adelges cooleyi]XP_050434549.1 facilitated trehalose transporter Tret1-like [Adelges cooleyi]
MDKGHKSISENTIAKRDKYGNSSTIHEYSDINLSNYLDNDEKCDEQYFIKEDIHQTEILQLSWNDLYPQVLASVVVFLLILQSGVNMAYSNVILHSFPNMNKSQYSWLTSIVPLCTPLGSILVGPIMERFGRKNACLCTCLPLLVSWLLAVGMTFDNIVWFYVSRICAGIGCGMATVVIVYVSEIAHPTYKSFLLSLNSVFFSTGVLLSTVLINFLDWKAITSTFALFTVAIMALTVICVPESPAWIFKFKGPEYEIKGKRAIKQIYPHNNRLFNAEWNLLNEMTADENNYAIDKSKQTFFRTLRTSQAAYKPVIILIVLLTLQQCSGAYMIISYALPVFQLIVPGGSANELEALALLGIIRFVGGIVTSLLSFYFGRRPLMVVSCLGMALSSATVTLTVGSQQTPIGSDQIGLTGLSVPLVGVMVFVLSSSIGVLVFPWTLTSELLPTSIRAVGSSSLVSYGCLSMFFTLRAFPYLLTSLGVAITFVGFGLVSLILAVFVLLFVPESNGKTFEQIEEYFLRK